MPRLARVLGLALTLAGVATLHAAAEGSRPSALPDPLELRAVLARRDFVALEQRIGELRATAQAEALGAAFDAFYSLPPAEDQALDAWLAARPDSLPAMLALAMRELGRAGESRGERWASETSERQMAAMLQHVRHADGLVERVLARDPGWLDAYRIRIELLHLTGDRERLEKTFRTALAIDPTHLAVWNAYLASLQSRWGGSYAALEEAAAAAQRYADRNPRLATLQVWPDWDRGNDAATAHQYSRAVALYTQALSRSESAGVLISRADAYLALHRPEAALADAQRAVALSPYEARAHERLAWALAALHRTDEALAEATRAAELEPTSADTVRYQRELAQYQKDLRAWKGRQVRLARLGPVAALIQFVTSALLLHQFLVLGLALLVWIAWYARRARRRAVATARPASGSPAPPTPIHVAGPASFRLARVGVLLLRAYVWLIALWTAETFAVSWPSLSPVVRHFDMPITATGLVGALGFAHGRRLLGPTPWKVWALVLPFWDLYHDFVIDGATLAQWPAWGFVYLLKLPIYASLLLYGFHSEALWSGAPLANPSRRTPLSAAR